MFHRESIDWTESSTSMGESNDTNLIDDPLEYIETESDENPIDIDEEIDIKYELPEYGCNMETEQVGCETDLVPGSLEINTMPSTNTAHTPVVVNSKQNPMNKLILLLCEHECETCLKNKEELCEHVRIIHSRIPHDEFIIDDNFELQTKIKLENEDSWNNIEIKCEPDLYLNQTSTNEECMPFNLKQKQLNRFSHILNQCELECETCQKFIKRLKEHRASADLLSSDRKSVV